MLLLPQILFFFFLNKVRQNNQTNENYWKIKLIFWLPFTDGLNKLRISISEEATQLNIG